VKKNKNKTVKQSSRRKKSKKGARRRRRRRKARRRNKKKKFGSNSQPRNSAKWLDDDRVASAEDSNTPHEKEKSNHPTPAACRLRLRLRRRQTTNFILLTGLTTLTEDEMRHRDTQKRHREAHRGTQRHTEAHRGTRRHRAHIL